MYHFNYIFFHCSKIKSEANRGYSGVGACAVMRTHTGTDKDIHF